MKRLFNLIAGACAALVLLLPQWWSILVGDISLVGPRPALFSQHDLIELRTQQGRVFFATKI